MGVPLAGQDVSQLSLVSTREGGVVLPASATPAGGGGGGASVGAIVGGVVGGLAAALLALLGARLARRLACFTQVLNVFQRSFHP